MGPRPMQIAYCSTAGTHLLCLFQTLGRNQRYDSIKTYAGCTTPSGTLPAVVMLYTLHPSTRTCRKQPCSQRSHTVLPASKPHAPNRASRRQSTQASTPTKRKPKTLLDIRPGNDARKTSKNAADNPLIFHNTTQKALRQTISRLYSVRWARAHTAQL